MDTSKVIELGSVSKQTQGSGFHIESFANLTPGPYVG